MNPWEQSCVSNGGIFEYLQTAGLKIESEEDDLVSLQRNIFALMDKYNDLEQIIKEDQDLGKVGDFVNLNEIRKKIGVLEGFSRYLQKINENQAVIKNCIKENSPGNQLYVDQEYQVEFFKIADIVKDLSILKIANQSGNVHESTFNKLSQVLSTNSVQMSQSIIDEIKHKKRQILKIIEKYNKPQF